VLHVAKPPLSRRPPGFLLQPTCCLLGQLLPVSIRLRWPLPGSLPFHGCRLLCPAQPPGPALLLGGVGQPVAAPTPEVGVAQVQILHPTPAAGTAEVHSGTRPQLDPGPVLHSLHLARTRGKGQHRPPTDDEELNQLRLPTGCILAPPGPMLGPARGTHCRPHPLVVNQLGCIHSKTRLYGRSGHVPLPPGPARCCSTCSADALCPLEITNETCRGTSINRVRPLGPEAPRSHQNGTIWIVRRFRPSCQSRTEAEERPKSMLFCSSSVSSGWRAQAAQARTRDSLFGHWVRRKRRKTASENAFRTRAGGLPERGRPQVGPAKKGSPASTGPAGPTARVARSE
jgi:hypothetical protein